jgi:hypothetical protein
VTAIQDAPPATTPAGGVGLPRPPRLRRRWSLVAVAVLLAVLGAGAAAVAFRSVSSTVPVVAAARTIERGTVIERADLAVVQVGVDPALSPVPGDRVEELVGLRAVWDTPQGALLTLDAVSDEVLPGQGRSVVGVSLADALLPGEPLRVGDAVRLVPTSGGTGEEVVADPWPARVVGLYPDAETSTTLVSVELAAQDAAPVAALVAEGRIALVLDSRER